MKNTGQNITYTEFFEKCPNSPLNEKEKIDVIKRYKVHAIYHVEGYIKHELKDDLVKYDISVDVEEDEKGIYFNAEAKLK